MRIIHKIGLNADSTIVKDFAAIGVEIPCGFTTFEIDEDDARWGDVLELSTRLECFHTVDTEFSKSEILQASYVGVLSKWLSGYPEPSNEFGYRKTTYSSNADTCENCGIGFTQQQPFLTKKEPKWGTKNILQLNWVPDEFFVTPDCWEAVFNPFGIGYREVINSRTAKALDTVVQLDISNRYFEFDLSCRTYEKEVCEECGREKYLPITRGMLPKLCVSPDLPIMKSAQLFGSGGNCFRITVVSDALLREMEAWGMSGLLFHPLSR